MAEAFTSAPCEARCPGTEFVAWALFRQMRERQRQREAHPARAEAYRERPPKPHEIARGWRREDLYTRGCAR